MLSVRMFEFFLAIRFVVYEFMMGFFLGGGVGVANVDTMSQKILGGFLQVYI